jgi:superfamily II DNA/RNA helicase
VDTRDQAFRAAKALSHHVKLRVALLPDLPAKGQQPPRDAKARLEGDRPVDVAVGTTAQVLYHLSNGLLSGKQVGHLVVDEADLVVTGHAFRTTQFNAVMAELSGLKGATFATSVLTRALRESLSGQASIQPLAELCSPNLHALPIGSSSFHFHPVNAFGDGKQQACLKILKDAPPTDRFVLFVNRPEAGSILQAFLRESLPAGVPPPVLIHSFVPEQQRSAAIQRFLDDANEDGIEPPRHLICTDWALRGLNVPSSVHILIYDLPKNLPEFIHRAGQAFPPTSGVKKRKVHALVSGSDRWLAEYVRLMVRNKQRLGTPLPPQSQEKKFESEQEQEQEQEQEEGYENGNGEDEGEIPLNINSTFP